MKKTALLTLLALILPIAPSMAHEAQISAEYPFAYPTSASQKNGAAYFTLLHMTREDDRILGVSTPIADKAELHITVGGEDQEVEMETVTMKKVEAIDVPHMSTLYFDPYGRHVMLMGLKKQLIEGEKFPLTLMFEKAGKVETEVLVVSNSMEVDAAGGKHWFPKAEHNHPHDDTYTHDHGSGADAHDDHDHGHEAEEAPHEGHDHEAEHGHTH